MAMVVRFSGEIAGWRKAEVAAAGAAVLFQWRCAAVPIARDQIQHHHAPGGQFALFALCRLPDFFVGVARRRIAMPVQKLRVGEFGVHAAGLRGALQVVARFGGVSLAFHLPGVRREIVGAPSDTNTQCQKEK